MLTRRTFTSALGATALCASIPSGFIGSARAQGAAPPASRGSYLIKNGAVVTVDAGSMLRMRRRS